MRSTDNYGYLSGLMFRSPIAVRHRNIALSGSLEGSLCYLNMVMVLVLNMTFLSDVLHLILSHNFSSRKPLGVRSTVNQACS